ncbi:hypothetical protein B0H21DRAFT_778633 [Amylocystis lapponica]|nr:hypothetical protein B0H21DRAFT_778633 [Amylocystis lapponica]
MSLEAMVAKGEGEDSDDLDPIQHELERTKEERDTLVTQYRNLLAKLTTMRTVLGNKLKQDAQLVQQLAAQNEDLSGTVQTLQSELIASNESERASREVEAIRSCALLSESLRRELDVERDAREREAALLEVERERSNNLQSQAAKDHELQQTVKGYESSSKNCRLLIQIAGLQEKSLLISKLRHEAVIMNEHLMEALRRLRHSSTDTNVDRRLVINVLLSFLKYAACGLQAFQNDISLLATVLSWRTGKRCAIHAAAASSVVLRCVSLQSFSRLWVGFPLTEATEGDGAPPSVKSSARKNGSLPSTPTRTSHLSPPILRGTKRLPSPQRWPARRI